MIEFLFVTGVLLLAAAAAQYMLLRHWAQHWPSILIGVCAGLILITVGALRGCVQ